MSHPAFCDFVPLRVIPLYTLIFIFQMCLYFARCRKSLDLYPVSASPHTLLYIHSSSQHFTICLFALIDFSLLLNGCWIEQLYWVWYHLHYQVCHFFFFSQIGQWLGNIPFFFHPQNEVILISPSSYYYFLNLLRWWFRRMKALSHWRSHRFGF